MKAITATTASIPPIYRHFAVVTILVTMVLALFADGDSGNAVAKVAKPQPGKASPAEPREDSSQDVAEASFGSGGQFGAPMVSPGGTTNTDLATAGPRQVAAKFNPTGLSDEEWAKLTPAQREQMLRKLHELQFGSSSAQRQAQIARLKSASAIRSGSSASDDD